MQNPPPSISQCLSMMEKYAMLPHIRAHSFVVARVAEQVHLQLSRNNSTRLPEKELVTAGGLLHDIAKTQCLEKDCDHARVGAEICMRHGYIEVAEIVKEHVRLTDYAAEHHSQGVFQAKELIFYSDKRVVHDQIVSLDERLQYILENYGNNDSAREKLIRKNFNRCRTLEDALCATAGCGRNDLLQGVSITPYSANSP